MLSARCWRSALDRQTSPPHSPHPLPPSHTHAAHCHQADSDSFASRKCPASPMQLNCCRIDMSTIPLSDEILHLVRIGTDQ